MSDEAKNRRERAETIARLYASDHVARRDLAAAIEDAQRQAVSNAAAAALPEFEAMVRDVANLRALVEAIPRVRTPLPCPRCRRAECPTMAGIADPADWQEALLDCSAAMAAAPGAPMRKLAHIVKRGTRKDSPPPPAPLVAVRETRRGHKPELTAWQEDYKRPGELVRYVRLTQAALEACGKPGDERARVMREAPGSDAGWGWLLFDGEGEVVGQSTAWWGTRDGAAAQCSTEARERYTLAEERVS